MTEISGAGVVHRETRRNVRTTRARAERPQAQETNLNSTQKTELSRVTNAPLLKRAAELQERTQEAPHARTDAENATLWWKEISDIQEGEGKDFPGTLTLPEGSEIVGILRREGDNLTCAIKNETNPEEVIEKTVSRQDILNAQLLEEKDAILSLFPEGPEKKALELQIQTLKPREETDTSFPPPAEVNKTIKEAAEKNGIMTTTKVKELVEWRRDAIKDNHDIQTQVQLDWLKGIEVAMEGKTLLDQKAIKAILLSPDLDKQIDQYSENIERYQTALEKEHFEKGSKEHKKLQEFKDIKKALEEGKTKLQDPEFMLEGTVIESVLSGTAEAETTALFGKNLEKAITRADPTDLLEQLAPVDDTWAEVLKGVEDEERRKSLMLLLAIFGTFIFNSGKDLLPPIAPER